MKAIPPSGSQQGLRLFEGWSVSCFRPRAVHVDAEDLEVFARQRGAMLLALMREAGDGFAAALPREQHLAAVVREVASMIMPAPAFTSSRTAPVSGVNMQSAPPGRKPSA
jgi:hypothetical protein